jgi:hypothetical protein
MVLHIRVNRLNRYLNLGGFFAKESIGLAGLEDLDRRVRFLPMVVEMLILAC